MDFDADLMPVDAFIDIRYFDGMDKSWVETLPLPDLRQRYLTRLTIVGFRRNRWTQLEVRIPFFDKSVFITHIEKDMFVTRTPADNDYILDDMYLTMPANLFVSCLNVR